ncbi:hypothetical protein N9095_00025 [bacterium]|nr:hypothetical protein [bacterium]
MNGWEKHNPRRTESLERKVKFDKLLYAKNKLSVTRPYEVFWLAYSLSMPVYEKCVGMLDTFDDNFVMKEEFEHSRVHAKLNDSYGNFKGYKFFWRMYYNFLMNSPFKEILILGEIKLQFNCLNVESRLVNYKESDMSDTMKKTLIYHDLEEIEHGLDLVPIITNYTTIWKIILFTVYTIHEVLFTILLRLQSILMVFRMDPVFTITRKIPVTLLYFMRNPLEDVHFDILYAIITNKFPSKKYRDQRVKEYIDISKKLFEHWTHRLCLHIRT